MPKLIDHAVRRRELGDAVWRVIARHGVGAVSVRTVAAEAGLSTGSLRHVLPTKGLLLAAAMELVIERGGEALTAGQGALETPDDVVAMLSVMLPVDEGSRLEMQVHLALIAESAAHPELAALRDAPYDAMRRVCRHVLERLDDGGRLRPGLDLDAEAVRLHVLVDGLAFHLVGSSSLEPGLATALLEEHLARIWRAGPA